MYRYALDLCREQPGSKYSEVSNDRAANFINLGDFYRPTFLSTYMAFLETARLFILGKILCQHGYWRQIFSDFLQFFAFKALFVQKYVFFKL